MSGFDGNKKNTFEQFIPISELAEEFGYAIDHISRLCRQGKVDAIREQNGRWQATKTSLIAYQEDAKRVKKEIAAKNLVAPSSSLRISDRIPPKKGEWMPGRVNFSTAFKTGLKFTLLGIFVFLAASSIFASAKDENLKESLKKLSRELTEVMVPRFKLAYDENQLTFAFGGKKFLNFESLKDEVDLVLYDFQTLSRLQSASIFDRYLSPILSPISNVLGRLFKSEIRDTAGFENQIKELRKQLEEAKLEVSGNKQLIEESLKKVLLVKEKEIITQIGEEKQIVTERRIMTLPYNVETRLLSVEQYLKEGENRFKGIELALSSVNNRFSYTPTIVVPVGDGGRQGVTISNPATTDSETVKASNLLDVTGDAQIARSLNVDSGTFYVNPTDNRVGINTTSLETALEVAGTASISGQLLVNGTGNTEFGGNVSVSGNFEIGANKFYVDSTNGRVGIRTQDLTAVFEVQGTASASYLLTGNTLQVGGYSSAAYSRFGTNTTGYGSFLTAASDLLVSGDLEIDGAAFFDSNASLSGNFELTGSSPLFGINAGNTINNTLEVGGTASISGNVSFGDKASISSNLQISGRFIADTSASHSFTGDLTVSKEFVSSGTASNSFAGSLLISKGLNAQAIVGTGLTVNGSTTLNGSLTTSGNTTLGDASGDTLTANADAWTFANDTNFTLSGGVNGLSFDTSTLSLDATNNRIGVLTTTPATTFEVQGTASASYFLTGNTLQVGGYSSVAYSRFGTDTTSHSNYITTTNDVLVSGDLEVNGSAAFDGNVSLGTTNTNVLIVNSSVTSNLIPFTNIYDIGSTTNRWRKIYVDSADITNLTAASSSISGTVASDFTINSDNATSDAEDESVTFERGNPSVNAAIAWDSTNKRFKFNFPVFLQTADAPEASYNFTKLTLKGVATDQSSNDYFEIQNSDGSRLLLVEQGGRLIASGSFQAGGSSVASAAYSRFGTSTTGHANYISASNDLLISGDLEVRGTVSFGGAASISGITSLNGIRYTWPSADGSSGQVLKTNGSGALSWGVGLASNSLDFDEFVNAATLDANLTIASAGYTFTITDATTTIGSLVSHTSGNVGVNAGGTIDTLFEVGGAASISGNITTLGTFTSTNTGSNSFSGGLEVTKGVHATGSITTGSDLRVNGNTNLNGIFVLGDNGDVGSINTSDWDIDTTGAITGVAFDANDTGNSLSNVDNADLTANTLDFTAISNSPTLDANLNISRAGFFVGIGAAPSTVFEVQGTASASYLLTGNTLQVGGFASVAYSRFGTSTTGHSNYISTTNDVLVSGDLEVRGTVSFGGAASISGITSLNGIRYTWPSADGSSGQVLKTNGSGALSWGVGLASNSLDFDEFVNAATLDANLTIASAGYNFDLNDTDLAGDGRWLLDIDGGFNADGSLTLGAGQDASIYFDGTDLQLVTDGAGAGGIRLNSEDDTLEFYGSDVLQFTADLDGIDLITGNTYQINNTDVLNATTLGSGIINSSLTSVGTIATGVWEATDVGLAHGGTGATLSDPNADRFFMWDDSAGATVLAGLGGFLTFSATPTLTVASDSLGFDQFQDSPTLDANLTINRGGFFVGIGAAPSTVFEVQGTASASYLLTGNTLQVGGFASVAYSRFGTGTTTNSNYIIGSDDLLISGDLQVLGTGSFNFASVSLGYFGGGLTNCDADNQTLAWTASTGRFSCGDDDTGGAGSVSSNSLDFDEFVNSMTLDADLTINRAGYKIGLGATPSTVFEVQGTASASYLLTGNTLQVGGFASVAYSRFGTSTTGHANYISTTNDVLVSGDLETRGTVSFGGVASVSGNLFAYGSNLFTGVLASELGYESLNDGMVLFLPFSEGTGTTAADRSKNGTNGTVTNSPTWAAGRVGNGLTFDGTTQKVQLGVPVVSGTGDFTMTAWINPASVTGSDFIMGNFGTGNLSGVEFFLSSGKVSLYITSTLNGTTALSANTWYHVAAVRSSGTVTLYLNGISDGSGSRADSIATSKNFAVGNGPDYTSEPFDGKIDEVKVYNRALAAADIRELYQRNLGTDATFTQISNGRVGIGTTTPTYNLDIYSAIGSDVKLGLTDADVSHGLATAVLPHDSTYGLLEALSSTAGGLQVSGASDTVGGIPLQLRGLFGQSNPTDTVPAINLIGGKWGAGPVIADLGALETVFQVQNNDNAAAFSILGDDKVGIGDPTPDYGLDVVGDINSDDCFREAGVQVAGTCASDIRLKKNIQPLTGSLDKILQLNPVEFEWKEGIEELGGNIRYVAGRQVGLVAQEVEAVLPHLVKERNGYLTVEYNLEMQMMLIGAIQEQQEEIASLSLTIDKIDARIASRSRLSADSGTIFDLDILFNSIVRKFYEAMNIVLEQGILKVAQIFTDKLIAKEICIEDVCIKKDQLKSILEQNGSYAPTPTPSPNESPAPAPEASESPTPEPAPSAESTPESTPEPTLETTPETTLEPNPLETPAPEPTPEPTLEPETTPNPTPEPTPEAESIE